MTRAKSGPTDVTSGVKSIDNRGRIEAAGLVSGAWRLWPGVSNALVWESAASRTAPLGGDAPAARQWRGRLRAYGWCRAQSKYESGDGFLTVAVVVLGVGWNPTPGKTGKGRTRAKEALAGAEASFVSVVMADTRGAATVSEALPL